jgi:hypothetical protein
MESTASSDMIPRLRADAIWLALLRRYFVAVILLHLLWEIASGSRN